MFRATERIVSSQSWYQGGYRANIVAYTIARVAHEVEEQGRAMDFESIWRQQALGPALVQAIAAIAEQVHNVLIDPPTGISNVTEWAKKQGCWDRIRMLDIKLPSKMADETISTAEQREEARDARRDQRQLNGIEAQIAVVNAGGKFWADALRWGRSRGLLTPAEAGVLDTAARIPQRTPTERQAAKALEVLARMQGEGYDVEVDETSR